MPTWTSWRLTCCLLSALAGNTWGAPRPLNDTGVDFCLSPTGKTQKQCAGTGQDADSGRDALTPRDGDGRAGFSYARVCHSGELAGTGTCPALPALGDGPDQWGCTRDKVTGLVWELKTADGGPRDLSRMFSHLGDGSPDDSSRYVQTVNAMGLCGASDWRLPTPGELQGLVDFGDQVPRRATDDAWFPQTYHGIESNYWAGQSGLSSGKGWTVEFTSYSLGDGRARQVGTLNGAVNKVRLVRGHQMPTGPGRFTVAGGEVTDHATGLVWRRCLEGQISTDTACEGWPWRGNWRRTISHAQSEALATGQAWRVPNAKELRSLVSDISGEIIDPLVFPQTPRKGQWTATPQDVDKKIPPVAWTLHFLYGYNYLEKISLPFSVRLVRDAP